MDLKILIIYFSICYCTAIYNKKRPTFHRSESMTRSKERRLFIDVVAKPDICTARVNGRYVIYVEMFNYHRTNRTASRRYSTREGLHTVALNPTSGKVVGRNFSPGMVPNGAYFALQELYNHVQPGHVIILCVLGEAAISLDRPAMEFFNGTRSQYLPDLQSRSPLAAVLVKGRGWVAEGYAVNLDAIDPQHPGYSVQVSTTLHVDDVLKAVNCRRNSALRNIHLKSSAKFEQEVLIERKRLDFCSRHDGYRELCDCSSPQNLSFPNKPFAGGGYFRTPIIVLASNRPRYLHRCLSSLLANKGLDKSRLVVYVDGDYPEVIDMLELLGVPFQQHVQESQLPSGQNIGTRIALNLKYAITDVFQRFPDADKVVVLEEDLEVSPDFVSFFQQTHHLLDEDISLYCVSAWNDHGYNHSSKDPSLLYRISYMPGLGWMMKRSTLMKEILPVWPPPWKVFDWDVMLRLPHHRKGRDCVIPDVSRTYHFGFEGNHVNVGMQYKFFYDHALNTLPDVRLNDIEKLTYAEYRREIFNLIKLAIPIDGASDGKTSSCSKLIPSNTKNNIYLILIKMFNEEDTQSWEKLATCLNLWDLDVRGEFAGVWRFWMHGNRILVIGVPYSDFSANAINTKGEMLVFSGKRSARETKLGRWPPGTHRETDEDKRNRLRLAAQALQISYAENS